MRALLDVNTLLALVDELHPRHAASRSWWQQNRSLGWGSCPLTQNGFLRIISQPSYTNAILLGEAIRLLRAATDSSVHEFWPDDLSLLHPDIVDHARMLGPKQLTDVYLLALAVKHGGRLVTLDRRIPITAVRGARPEHLVVV